MNRAAKRYRGRVTRALRCSRVTKGKLLQEFDDAFHAFLEEEPDADYAGIVRAFGAPAAMAAAMCEGLPKQEGQAWRRSRLISVLILFVAAVAVISTAAYAIAVHNANLTIEVDETVIVYEGNILSDESE